MSPSVAKRYGKASDSLGFGYMGVYSDLLFIADNRPMETASDRRKRRLQALCELHGVTEVAKRAEVNPDALRQVLNGILLPPKQDGSRSPRSLGNKTARDIEKAFGLGEGWFDQSGESPVGTSRHPLDSAGKAHAMSLPNARISPPALVAWGDLLSADLSVDFEVALDDDAMAPAFPAGRIVRFRPAPADGRVAFGKHVLLRDRGGAFHFRKLAQSDEEEWAGKPRDDAFKTIYPDKHGASIVAVMRGYYVEEE